MADDALEMPARPPFPAERIEAILADVDAGRDDANSAFFTIIWDVLGIERYRGVHMPRLDSIRAVSEDLRVGRISEAEAWERVQDVADFAYVDDSGGMLPELETEETTFDPPLALAEAFAEIRRRLAAESLESG